MTDRPLTDNGRRILIEMIDRERRETDSDWDRAFHTGPGEGRSMSGLYDRGLVETVYYGGRPVSVWEKPRYRLTPAGRAIAEGLVAEREARDARIRAILGSHRAHEEGKTE